MYTIIVTKGTERSDEYPIQSILDCGGGPYQTEILSTALLDAAKFNDARQFPNWVRYDVAEINIL